MNVKRMLLGGLLAGVFLNVTEGVLNAVILMDDYQAMLEMYGLPEASWAMTGYVIGALVFGFAAAWLYAAIRPRFGAGWMTGAFAGIVLWVIGYAVPTIWFGAIGLSLSVGGTTFTLVWGLVELILAGVIAGWVYQERGAPAAADTA